MRFYPILCVALLALGGCGASSTSAHPHIRHDVAMVKWGINGLSDIQTLDPALASDPTSISVSSLVYGGLVRLDSRLRVQPDGASRWIISRDGRVYTFTVRPNLRFADGRHVTAGDFVSALTRALGPDGSAGSASFYLGLIAVRSSIEKGHTRTVRGIQAVNNSTLRITLVRPAAHFLAQLAFPVSFVPDPLLLGRYGAHWTDHAAGFGPFQVREWRHTRYLRLGPNPYYYGGKPTLKDIMLRFFPDGSGLQSYKAGSLDVLTGIEAGQSLVDHPSGLRRVPGLALDYLAFNTSRLPFHRLNARRAFSALWSPTMAASTMGNSAFPAHGIPPSAFGLPAERWQPARSPSSYLSAARFPRGRGLPPITMVLPRDPHLLALARDLRQVWKTRLGVTVTMRQLNASNYGKVLSAHAFDVALVAWGGDYPDPQDFLGTQLGSTADNITGWTRTAYDRSVALADTYNPRDPRRLSLLQQAAQLATRGLPILPLDEPSQTAIIRPDLIGVDLTPLGTIAGDWAHVHTRG